MTITKKPVLLLFYLIFLSSLGYGQLRPRTTSKLNSGNWYQLSISKSGIYKLDYNFLTSEMKIPASELDFSKIGIFGYGGGTLPEDNQYNPYSDFLPENAIEIYDQNNNKILENGDYVLFYADGPYHWRYDANSSQFVHTSAFYTDVQRFFITTTEGSQKRISSQNLSGSPSKIQSSYDYYDVLDKDSINPNLSGRIWFSSSISNFKKNIQLPLPIDACTGGESVQLSYSYYTKLSNATVHIDINGQSVKSQPLSPNDDLITDTFRTLCPGSNATIGFTISSSIEQNFYLDYIRVNTKANLAYSGKQFNFRFRDNIGLSSIQQAQFSSNGFRVWNVSDIRSIKNVTLNGNGFLFNNNTLQEFVAFQDKDAYTPTAIGKVSNQNITGIPKAHNLIVTYKTWMSVANELAQFHKEESGTESQVVDIEKVYNEYSSGNKDVMGIRRFIIDQYHKDPNSSIQLSSVTFFGKPCVDFKGISKSCEDYVSTYETAVPSDFLRSFCTDDFFGLLEDNQTNLDGSDRTLAIGIGRLPVTTLQEAKDVLNKIKAYKSKESYSDWRNNSTIVSDDYDDPVDASFYTQNQVLAQAIADMHIKTNLNKIYLDAFNQEQFSGGQRYEDAEKMLKDNITFGSLLITYIGHGGFANWAQERILSVSDLPIYQNLHSLPFMTTATCGFAPYDKPSATKSAGESFLLQKDGGAISMLTTCREVLISDQGPFMNHFFNQFYNRKSNGRFQSFGDIMRLTKNANNVDLNSQKVVLLGDPALTINMPIYNVVTTSISNGTDDTLKALSKMTITGEVRNLNNSLMTDFNGFCQVTVFDKKVQNKLNYNDVKDPLIPKDTFDVQNSRIFRGSTTVSNGKFTIQFIVPKDINYAIGLGRVSYYAADVNAKPYRDAAGMDTSVWVGSANLKAEKDEKPPVVKLFMNDDKFAFGGITHADPILLAKLSDESGINTTGAGIGHDITAVLDDNVRLPIILNNYYKTDPGDFRSGSTQYPFYQLKQGKHTIRVKAWDVYNNPGEGYLEFYVAKDEGIALRHVLNYPNPFTTNTYFQFEHNRPNQPLDVSINVLTISGKVVKRIYQKLTTDGFRVDKQIPWNGRDDFGDKIGRGLYVYVVTIRDTKGEVAHQYEKLVLLQ